MRALQQPSLTGPQDMRLITDVPVPRPGRGEVLIRVVAAGVNYADVSRAYGTFLGGPQPPYVAGFEAAGEVVAVGDVVDGPPSGRSSPAWATAPSPSTWSSPPPQRCRSRRVDRRAGTRAGRELARGPRRADVTGPGRRG